MATAFPSVENLRIPQSPPQLSGFHLESKWGTDDLMLGLSSDCEDIIAVRDKNIQVFGMKGENKGKIDCQGLVCARDIAVMNKQLVVSDYGKREILVMDRKGKIGKIISLPAQEHGWRGALYLAVDQAMEDIYISSCKTNIVYKCPKGQTQVHPFITTGFNSPYYICVTPTHEIIVSNSYSHIVCKYDSEGTLVWEYGGQGSGEGKLNTPMGVCVDSWGHVFVCDWGNFSIQYLSPEGKFLSDVGKFGGDISLSQAITFNNDRIIVASQMPDKICVFKCQYK